jgi:hypothetical protein
MAKPMKMKMIPNVTANGKPDSRKHGRIASSDPKVPGAIGIRPT